MKWNYVIGNPAYQISTGRTEQQTQGNSSWVYPAFQNAADEICDASCLIYPFGGWFDAPSNLQGFGKKLMTDKHTQSIRAYEGTSDKRAWYRTDKAPKPVFDTNANLSAGVAIVCRDNNHEHDSFKYSNRVYSDEIANIPVSSDCNFPPNPVFCGISNKLTGEKLHVLIKKGIFGIESNFVENNPSLVAKSKEEMEHPVYLLANDKAGSAGRAKWYWIEEKNIPSGHEYLGKHKVITTSAYPKQKFTSGNPTLSNVHSRLGELIEILEPGTAFGRSRMLLYSSDNRKECENYLKYTQTKFFAGLMLQEPNRRSSFGYVIPLQDFTADSDIDWDTSIPQIDNQLYRKYDLSQQERNFIEQQ